MRKTLTLAAALVFIGCSGTTEADYREPIVTLDAPVEVTLRIGEVTKVGDSALNAELLHVVEDSRCPIDVTCVWAGNASVEVRLTVGTQPATTLRVNTATAPTSVDYGTVTFSIVKVTPDPEQAVPTVPADYRVTLRFAQR